MEFLEVNRPEDEFVLNKRASNPFDTLQKQARILTKSASIIAEIANQFRHEALIATTAKTVHSAAFILRTIRKEEQRDPLAPISFRNAVERRLRQPKRLGAGRR